jgi:curved DNA-binding protein CbpA
MHDYYQVLGVARDASPPVVKYAFEGKAKALADPAYAASPEEKREEERLLREAYVTLSVPAKRSAYDAKLAAFESAPASGASSRPPWLVPAVAAAVVAVAAGGLLANHAREKERLRIEEQRIALEKEEARRKSDLEDERIRELRARQEESTEQARLRGEQLRMQRERVEYERWKRTEEMRARQGESMRESQERRAAAEKQREEESARRAEEDRRRQAQREVDRQKEYLRRQELEEERIRAARHEQAQREARELEYRQYLEEQRRRLQQR